jgi:hypothetical protein
MLDDLIARLKAAKEPGPHLDAEIALAILYSGWVRHPYVDNECPDWMKRELWPSVEKFHAWRDHNEPVKRAIAPLYTSSLDAAMTLVPDNSWWGLMMCDADAGFDAACCTSVTARDLEQPVWHRARTAALALCIAALEARKSCQTT